MSPSLLPHLPPQLALNSMLSCFADMATKLHQMRVFCRCVLKGGGGRYMVCRTYEAFASGLHSCMDQVLGRVRDLEEQLVKKGEEGIL